MTLWWSKVSRRLDLYVAFVCLCVTVALEDDFGLKEGAAPVLLFISITHIWQLTATRLTPLCCHLVHLTGWLCAALQCTVAPTLIAKTKMIVFLVLMSYLLCGGNFLKTTFVNSKELLLLPEEFILKLVQVPQGKKYRKDNLLSPYLARRGFLYARCL